VLTHGKVLHHAHACHRCCRSGDRLFLLVTSTVKIVQEYERGVIFRLGRLVGPRGLGLFFLIPYVERMRKIDLRIVTLEVSAQEAITRDNVTVKVNAVVYFRVVTPEDAVVKAASAVRNGNMPKAPTVSPA
jgi:regulator of protease activity HflC (stomatin/prohibitin superfamily)